LRRDMQGVDMDTVAQRVASDHAARAPLASGPGCGAWLAPIPRDGRDASQIGDLRRQFVRVPGQNGGTFPESTMLRRNRPVRRKFRDPRSVSKLPRERIRIAPRCYSRQGGAYLMDKMRRQLQDVLPSLRRFARALARDTHDSDDLVQMTCELALDRSDQWHPDTRLETWLFQLMQAVWLNEMRSKKVRDRYQDDEQTKPQDDAHPPTADGALEAKMLLDRVENEIFRLPEHERVLLLLICVEGYSYKEAAEMLRVPIGTVMSRLSRARVSLTNRLEAGDPATDNVRMMSTWRN
jgi:RNA polymerase sigma-70 factor (ECF subfamily)